MATKQFTAAEVARHNTEGDCWIIVQGRVFDVTKFLDKHPGGKKILVKVAGQDASKQFEQFHDAGMVLARFGPDLQIGVIASAMASVAAAEPKAAAKGKLFRGEGQHFGDMLPFADPMWMQDWYSPYYNESHFRLAKELREKIEEHLMPHVDEIEEAKWMPKELYKKWGQMGLLAFAQAPEIYKDLPADFPIPAGLKPDTIDNFHKMVARFEYARMGSSGVNSGIFSGINIALPPIMFFGSEAMKKRVIPDVVNGNNWICLAITEPTGGSDTANITTSAVLSDDGKHYIVNGTKKWITNGVYAEYFTTAVRTGGPGASGVSMLLIERKFGGVTTRKIETQGAWASGSTFVEFNDVKVPVENIIGQLNQGFKVLMYNFNSERIGSISHAIFSTRVAYDEALRYAHKRRTFGKLLIEHPVIRAKLANMARQIEAAHAWLELVVYQVEKFKDYRLMNDRIGATTALLKAHGSLVAEYVLREAAQIFGGLAYTRGGQAAKVERLYREVRFFAIPAGSEEVMLDFGVRDSLKKAQAMGAKLGGSL